MLQYFQNLSIKKRSYVPKCTTLTTFQQYLAYIRIQNCNNQLTNAFLVSILYLYCVSLFLVNGLCLKMLVLYLWF